MAQIKKTVLVDDIDGGNAEETVEFSLDGTDYEIELNSENAAALRDALATYVEKGRKAGRSASPRPRASGTPRPASSGPDASLVRAWARENGLDVAPRGRISSEVVSAYTDSLES